MDRIPDELLYLFIFYFIYVEKREYDWHLVLIQFI